MINCGGVAGCSSSSSSPYILKHLFRSALGQLQLYDSHLRISLPLSNGKHRDRFQVFLQVDDQAMVVNVASVEFPKNPPSFIHPQDDLLPTSDDQYYDIARLLDDLDKRFFSALGPDPRQICMDLANMSLSNPTRTGSRKPPLGWLSEHTLQREVSSEVISAQAHLEYGPGHIPKSTTFLHTVDQRGLRHESKRLQTFMDWPQSTPVKPEHLAAAGFFYIGRGDNVQCCTCGNVLNHWREGDDPELEHFYRFPDCEFAIGYDVGNVPISSSLEPRQETVSSLERELDRLKEERMCKICMEEDAVIVFLPCGHLAVCQQCSATLHNCPICRKQIDRTVRVFMS